MERSKILMADPNFKNQFSRSTTFPGVRTALGLDKIKGLNPSLGSSPVSDSSSPNLNLSLNLGSDISYGHWDIPYGTTTDLMEDGSTMAQLDPNMMRPKKIFRGSGRERTLKICGWGADDTELAKFLFDLEKVTS